MPAIVATSHAFDEAARTWAALVAQLADAERERDHLVGIVARIPPAQPDVPRAAEALRHVRRCAEMRAALVAIERAVKPRAGQWRGLSQNAPCASPMNWQVLAAATAALDQESVTLPDAWIAGVATVTALLRELREMRAAAVS